MTMLILLGSAVQDSANGDDVYKAFMIRMALFIAVTLYAWLAIYLLERLRTRRLSRKSLSLPDLESSRC
jgi:peptidoglycan/LPS O-acetylase OafA/YrhL